MKFKSVALLVLILIVNKIFAQLPLDTAAYSHPIITVTNKHFITSWGQFGQFDTSVVAAGTNLGGAYLNKQGTPTHHLVLINDGGTFSIGGVEVDACAYIDFIGWGSADPYGIIVNAANAGFAWPIEGKSHDLQFIGMNMTGGTQEGFTAKIEEADFASKYLCDTSVAHFIQHNIKISNCKVRNNGGEAAYMNSTGWDSRDQVHGNNPFLGCPIGIDNNFRHSQTIIVDTIRNTGTVTNKIFFDKIIQAANKALNFHVVVTKISGTVSGTVSLSGSNNGTTYSVIQSQTLTNATNTYIFNLANIQFSYYKTDIVTSGTMLATSSVYTQFYYNPPPSDTILVDSNVFINPGRSAVNFSDMAHAFFRGNKGWHIGRELNGDQGKLLACGGRVGYLGDTIQVTGNKCFGSYNNNYWFASEGVLNFANNYGDSAGYWATTKNPQETPATQFGVTTNAPWNQDSVTWRICNNQAFVNSSVPSTQFNLSPGPQNTNRNVVGGNNGFTQINGAFQYSTNCGAVQNQPPTCNPGNNATIQLPQNSYFFSQASANDADGTITTILWTQVSGPNTGTFTNTGILQPTVSGLIVGTYVFNLMVTDNGGLTANKNITITVIAAANQPPNVNAGYDTTFTLPKSSYHIISASASDPDGTISSLLWTQISGPNTATINNNHIISPTVSGLIQGVYLFKLTATDNGGLSRSDTMQITVNHALNKRPIVFAGNNVVLQLPTNTYTFADATASDPDGVIVAYKWQKISGGVAVITNGNTLHATVSNLVAGTYIFRLTVTDDSGATAGSRVTVVVNSAPNSPPICNAGNDTTLQLPTNSYQTHATASDPDGTIASYSWVKFQGTGGTISNPAILTPLISNLQADIYGFSLTVTDNLGATFTDTIFITVLPAPNSPPVCNAGGNVTITLPINSYQVAATASDPDGFITAYSWIKLSGGTATISNASILNPLITNLVQGVYQFQLTVTDNSGATATSVLTITVNHALNIPPSANAGADAVITLPINSYQVTGASATDQDGVVVSTVWTQLSGGSYTINNPNLLNPLFSNLTQGTYKFILTATDDSGAVGRDTLQIIVNHALNKPPVVNAGNDTTIQLPATTVNLIGTASDPDGTIVSTLWTNSDGCSITSASSLVTTATCSTSGTHIFQLSATDDSSITSFDNKQAIVLPAINFPPVAIASDDTTVYKPLDSLTLTQSGTQAGGGSIIAYLSTILSSNFSPFITNATTTTPTVHGFSAGDTIRILLRVTNNNNIYGYDTTTIIILPDTTNNPPTPVIIARPSLQIRLPRSIITLDASTSYDHDAGDYIAAYVWQQTSGGAVTLSGTSGSVLTISNLTTGTYTFLLTITDSKGAQAQQSVTIYVGALVRVKVNKATIR